MIATDLLQVDGSSWQNILTEDGTENIYNRNISHCQSLWGFWNKDTTTAVGKKKLNHYFNPLPHVSVWCQHFRVGTPPPSFLCTRQWKEFTCWYGFSPVYLSAPHPICYFSLPCRSICVDFPFGSLFTQWIIPKPEKYHKMHLFWPELSLSVISSREINKYNTDSSNHLHLPQELSLLIQIDRFLSSLPGKLS